MAVELLLNRIKKTIPRTVGILAPWRSFRRKGLTASSANNLCNFSMMNLLVLSARYQSQIFNSIIGFILFTSERIFSTAMMNNLTRSKGHTEMCNHYQDLFWHIAIPPRIRMLRLSDKNISSLLA